ncbi:MAG: hypothetical protein WCV90_02210 [Candidatus Woesearchaeota archaeon]
MNTIVKYLAIGTLALTALISIQNASYDARVTPHPEVTRGRITNYQEHPEHHGERIVSFNVEYITGERRQCTRLMNEEGNMYGDCGIIGSGNHRSKNNPFPNGSIDICCFDGRQYSGRCVLPEDSHYEGCMKELDWYTKESQK